MGNKLIYGCQNFCAIPHVVSSNVRSLGTPVSLDSMGLVNVDPALTEEINTLYADNKKWASFPAAKEYAVKLAFRYLSALYVSYVGFKVSTSNGGISDSGNYPDHAICYESLEFDDETKTETRTLHYYYNVTAKRPTVALDTKQGNQQSDSALINIELTAEDCDFIFDEDGKKVAYFEITRTAENAALYDSFITAAILPTSEIPDSQG